MLSNIQPYSIQLNFFVLSICFYFILVYIYSHCSLVYVNVKFAVIQGIVFFNLEDEIPLHDQSKYIWADADWPQNGWAGSESTPVPTFVSPGVGLGSNKGAHLGLGDATIGVGSLARPGRDLTGGLAFGIPGYAGIGASALGWETQDDFEDYVDPPATVENISTRAFSSHPLRPFFLVGSSNTHIYLWEVGNLTENNFIL